MLRAHQDGTNASKLENSEEEVMGLADVATAPGSSGSTSGQSTDGISIQGLTLLFF